MPTPNPYQPITPRARVQAASATGSVGGVFYVANAYGFKVGAAVNVTGTALPTLRCTITSIDLTTSPQEILLSDGDGTPPVLTSYTVAASSTITQLQEHVHQQRMQVDIDAQTTPLVVSGTVTATTGGLTDAELRASPVPVFGPLTDTQLRASPVPVSGPVTSAELATALEDVGFVSNMPLRLGVIVSPSASRNNDSTTTPFALTDKIQLLPDVAVYIKFGTTNAITVSSSDYSDIIKAGERYPVDMKTGYAYVAVIAVVTGTANVVVSDLVA